MGKYAVEPSAWQGSAYPANMPIDVVDAGGQVINEEWIIYFDTDTGVVITSVRDKNGFMVTGLAGAPKYRVQVFPAPLSIRPFKKPVILLPGQK